MKGLKRDWRLRKSRDFELVLREGRSFAGPFLVLRVRPNEQEKSRLGVVVGKRIGKAVVRNKVKRRLREAWRLSPVDGGWDVVLIARKEAASATYQELSQELHRLLQRARLLRSPAQKAEKGGG